MQLPPDLSTARTFGPFVLLGAVGHGGAGEVYRALDRRDGRAVALKLLHPSPSDRAAAARTAAEIDTARRLHHPNIVRIHDAGVSEGRPWLAMEPLAGCNLERYTRPARLLPEAAVLHLSACVADALACAHAQQVVHRDVKPSNVIVDWAAGRVTLTDFGVARSADAERTATGVVVGTPVYMAPELLAGAEATPASDLYALGVMMFQLLAGRLPHEADTLGALLRAVTTAPVPDLALLKPGLSPAVANWVRRLLARDPNERPAEAALVAAGLRALAAAASVPPLPSSPPLR